MDHGVIIVNVGRPPRDERTNAEVIEDMRRLGIGEKDLDRMRAALDDLSAESVPDDGFEPRITLRDWHDGAIIMQALEHMVDHVPSPDFEDLISMTEIMGRINTLGLAVTSEINRLRVELEASEDADSAPDDRKEDQK